MYFKNDFLSIFLSKTRVKKGEELTHPLVKDTIDLFLDLSTDNIKKAIEKNSLKQLFSHIEKAEKFTLTIQKEIEKIDTEKQDAELSKNSAEKLQGLYFLLHTVNQSSDELREAIHETLNEFSFTSFISEIFCKKPPKTLSKEEIELFKKATDLKNASSHAMRIAHHKALVCMQAAHLSQQQKKTNDSLLNFLDGLERLNFLKFAGCKKNELVECLQTLLQLEKMSDLQPDELQKKLLQLEQLIAFIYTAQTNIQQLASQGIVKANDLQNALLLTNSLQTIIRNVSKISRFVSEKIADKLNDTDTLTFLYNIVSSVFSKNTSSKKLSKEDEKTYHLAQKIAQTAHYAKAQSELLEQTLKQRVLFPQMKIALPNIEIKPK